MGVFALHGIIISMKRQTNWDNRSYTKEEFIEAWNSSNSKAKVLEKLGLNKSGTAYSIMKRIAEELGLDDGHLIYTFEGVRKEYELKEILIKNSPYSNTTNLRIKLIKNGLKEAKCEGCGLTDWLGEEPPLSLDHINGDNKDNRIENLRILCLNCHGKTDTWCGKNKIRKTANGSYPGENLKKYFCACGKQIQKKNLACRECTNRELMDSSKYPPVDEILDEVRSSSYEAVGREYGVSGNAIRKYIKNRKPEGFILSRYML